MRPPDCVAQRRRQIGIRRALGATRLAALRHFQKENLIIANVGVLIGILLAVALNLWLVSRFEMVRLDAAYVSHRQWAGHAPARPARRILAGNARVTGAAGAGGSGHVSHLMGHAIFIRSYCFISFPTFLTISSITAHRAAQPDLQPPEISVSFHWRS
jgi:ABC-type antimicrobial peptide transport system permease subunit